MTPFPSNITVIQIVLFAVVFAAREYFAFRGNLKGKYILTPLVTLVIITIAVYGIGRGGLTPYRSLVTMSLMAALVADTLLMIVETDLLKYGLVYFLAGHLFYIAAFFTGYEFALWHIPLGLVIALAAAWEFSLFRGKTGGMDTAILLYMVVISVMLFSALAGLSGGFTVKRTLIAAGALLFAASDSVLGVNAFVRPLEKSTVITWALYGPAQLLIALSCVA